MVTRNGINIFGHYVVSINARCLFINVFCIIQNRKTEHNRILYCF